MPISRLFSNATDANAAVDDLKQDGYGGSEIHVLTKADDVNAASFVLRGIPGARAPYYIEHLEQGGALVIIDAPMGGGARATELLERPRAGDVGVVKAIHEFGTLGAATPLSSAFGIKVLTQDPAPLSTFWRIPTLSRRQGPGIRSHGFPLLLNKAAPLSTSVGLRPLIDKAALLSGWIGMKVLSSNPAPLSSWIKMPVLAKSKSILY